MKIIECRNVTHYYGSKLIYENLSFGVEKGSIMGLLGKNGTGKTTIINILNGYLEPRSGQCLMFGQDINTLTPDQKARIGLLLEGHVQHSYFNPIQIEKFYSGFFRNWNREAYYGLLDKLKVSHSQKVSSMSRGQRSQVALGLLFAQDPEIMILDDFSMGLDPGYRRLFIEYLKEFTTAGNKTVFLTSHIIQDMEMLIDDCIILDYGKILLHRPVSYIMERFSEFLCSGPDADAGDGVLENIAAACSAYSVERMPDHRIRFYSFMEPSEVKVILDNMHLEMTSERRLSLEDAFIGLTGKY